MTATKLSDEVRAFLDTYFPGGTIDDGYYFVSIEPRVLRRIKDDPFQYLQRVADRVTERPCWAIVVGADPRPFLRASTIEERTVVYTPDWNVEQKLTQWIAALHPGSVDLHAVLAALVWPAALVFIDPSRRIVFDARMRRVHAPSDADVNAFFEGIEGCIEAG